MAQKVLTELVDDIDGSPAAETVEVNLDGVIYEVDLSAGHAQQLREQLDPFIKASRRSDGAPRARRKPRDSRVTPAPARAPHATPTQESATRPQSVTPSSSPSATKPAAPAGTGHIRELMQQAKAARTAHLATNEHAPEDEVALEDRVTPPESPPAQEESRAEPNTEAPVLNLPLFLPPS